MATVERKASPSVGKLLWGEILERGYFDSKPPLPIGLIPNPEEFLAAIVDDLETLKNSGGTVGICDQDPPPVIARAIEPVLEYGRRVGVNFDRTDVTWNLSPSPLSRKSLNTHPHADLDLFSAASYYDELPPEDHLRFTMATVVGTLFYPGRFYLGGPEVRNILGHAKSNVIKSIAIDKEIGKQAEKMIPVVRDSSVIRTLLSVTFSPKQIAKL